MAQFIIEGGYELSGDIIPQGAKNEALQVICAVLLTDEDVVIKNIPSILDVNNLISLLSDMGVSIKNLGNGEMIFRAEDLNINFLNSRDFLKKCTSLRGSLMLIGPLLSRLGWAKYAKSGGDKIGRRRVDTHFVGMEKLGAKVEYDNDLSAYIFSADKLNGCYMLLDEASVTGTANIIMASVLADGETIIYNAACEPYVQQLCKLLVNMGAKINGVGSNLLTINGVKSLHGANHTILPDMIEIGSFIGIAAMTKSKITIKNTSYQNLGIIPYWFKRLGVCLEQVNDDIIVDARSGYEVDTDIDGSILTISDAPWPGLSPDLLSIFLVVATQAKGSVLIHQKMFESRLFFVDKLIDMGAKIILCDPHRAVVIGNNHQIPLRANNMESPDIRAGISLLIAALNAKGRSKIERIDQIDRGYERIEERLTRLGAKIIAHRG